MGVDIKTVRDTAVSIELGSMENLPRLTRHGFATPYQAASKFYPRYEMTNSLYSNALKGIRLLPDFTPGNTTASNVQVVSGSITTVSIPGRGQHIYAYTAAAEAAAKVRSKAFFRENPSIISYIQRPQGQPGGTSVPLSFEFEFGATEEAAAYKLAFGGYQNPQLSLGGVLLSEYQIRNNEWDTYLHQEKTRWEIYPVGGDLHIVSSMFSDPWILYGYGAISAGYWWLQGTGGPWAANVWQLQYAKSGSFTVPAIEHYNIYGDITESRVFPSVQDGTVTVVPEDEGTGLANRAYTIQLTGDGYHSPLVQGWQVIYEPTYEAGSDRWDAVDSYLREMSDSLPEDLTSRTASFTFANTGGFTGQSFANVLKLLQLDGEYERGQMLLRYRLGYRLQDESVVDVPCGTVIAKVRREGYPLRGAETYTLDCVDRSAMWADMELWWAPCLQGMALSDAVIYLLLWLGVSYDEMAIDLSLQGITIDDPGRNYDDPAWNIANGTNGADALRQLCDAYNLRIYWGTDSLCHVVPWDYEPGNEIQTYTTAAGNYASVTMRDLTTTRDLTGDAAKNAVFVQGRGGDGEPVYAGAWLRDSVSTPGMDEYLGYLAIKTIRNDDITTVEHAGTVAMQQLLKLPIGCRRVTLTGQGTLWDLRPRYLFNLEDTHGYGAGQYRVKEMSRAIRHKSVTIDTSVTGEELPYALRS